MKFVPKRHEPEDLNISPLIDMVFILLIFFAVSTTFVKDMQIELQRPSAESSQQASTKSVRVYIDQGGQVYVNEKPTNSWMVQSMVRDALAVSTEQKVLVVADESTPTRKLVEVVDQAQLAGAQDVGVATERN
jgi:biopolymer transport protein ExbD